MLAYNLSPSFNWDTTGMSDDEMRRFPEELGKLGFVFNFITYGGHQIDGLAGEEFATALQQDGMLALARLQRKIRLLESPYRRRRRWSAARALDARADGLVRPHRDDQGDGQGLDPVPAPGPDRGADRSCSRSGSRSGRRTTSSPAPLRVALRPHRAGSELLELQRPRRGRRRRWPTSSSRTIQDRRGRSILSVRDQNTFDEALRKKRLMTLIHLFLIHRYKVGLGALRQPDRGQPLPDRRR